MDLGGSKNPVYRRTKNTLDRLRKDELLGEALNIMAKYLECEHVEEVLPSELISTYPVNYIPIFCVKHPSKKLRIVFDSAASYAGKSLNNYLLQGPDINNKLSGVLTRFRDNQVGFTAHIECLFHCFDVEPHSAAGYDG